jgi:subfamily B ATP-binding cassette protein MsbA
LIASRKYNNLGNAIGCKGLLCCLSLIFAAMKSLFKILKYTRPYAGFVWLNVLFNFLSILGGVFSITLVMPVLRLLFYPEALVLKDPGFEFTFKSIYDNFYYNLSVFVQNDSKQALVVICLLLVAMTFLKNLFRYLALYFLIPLRNYAIRDLRRALYEKTLRLPLSYFSDEKKGDLITRMSNDISEVEWSIMGSLEVLFKEPMTIIIFLGWLIMISPSLTAFIFIMMPVMILIIWRIGKTLKSQSGRNQSKLGEVISLFEETLSGMRIIQAFKAEGFFKRRFFMENKVLTNISVAINRKRDLSSPLSETLTITIFAVVLFYGGRMVLDHSMPAEVFIGFIAIFSQIIPPAKSFSDAYYKMQKGAASLDRVESILNAEEKISELPDAISKEKFNDEIVFENVSFAYEKEPVLDNINLRIKKGSTVALVGPSGGGKSTLADLLPRFQDPVSGVVKVDGVPIRNYKLADLRGMIGIVTQESILFNDSIYNNIAFGLTGISTAEIVMAARIANAHDFIMDTERGYQTNIGDRGNKLSGGQKQRISIARAILRNPDILILDEATSSLDTTSERLVQDALNNLMKNRTSIVIAHRLSTIQNADHIVVLEKGKIVQEGTHAELNSREGLYRMLNEMQRS